MTIYAIGDVQGCYAELLTLLRQIEFDPARDHLWFTGDLVNRGPQSLEVLRFVEGLGERAVTVLGNHDLHLLAVACRKERKPHRLDTLNEVLAAPDREELLEWLRHRPLLHHDETSGFTLVHAGLPPQWNLAQARRCAKEVEAVLRHGDYANLFRHMYGDLPDCWQEELTGWDRLRFITNCLTRLRYCDRHGRLTLSEEAKGPPGTQAPELLPWYAVPNRASGGMKIIFGHWSTLRMSRAEMDLHQVYPLDTGCNWGGYLTALRLSDLRFFSVAAERLYSQLPA